MELANQQQTKNPLDDDIPMDQRSMDTFKLSHDEYSIQLDSDTLKCFTTKKKFSPFLSNDDEHDMRTFEFKSHTMMLFLMAAKRKR